MNSLTHLVALFATLLTFLTLQVLAAPGYHASLAKARRSIDLTSGDIDTFLDAHNVIRAQYGAPPLKWSPLLARKAGVWADLCMMKHSDGILLSEAYGEHIVAATGDFPILDAVSTFLQGKGARLRSGHSPSRPTFHRLTGLTLPLSFVLFPRVPDQYSPDKPVYNHWTQVVWKSTTELGCAIASCRNAISNNRSRETMYVCLYNPAGNVIGQAPYVFNTQSLKRITELFLVQGKCPVVNITRHPPRSNSLPVPPPDEGDVCTPHHAPVGLGGAHCSRF